MKGLAGAIALLWAELVGRIECARERHVWRMVRPAIVIDREAFDMCVRCGRVRIPPR